jgi:hypothetical protein
LPYNGSGVFTLVSGNPVVTGTVISSTVQNNTMADIVNNGLTNCLTKDGQQTPTANIPLGGFRLTGVGNAVNAQDAVTAAQLQGGALMTLTSVAGTDTITANTLPVTAAYVAGQTFDLPVAGANTTNNVTININALGAKNVTKFGGVGLVPGDLQGTVKLRYDGTQFQLISAPAVAMAPVGASRNVLMSLAAAGTSATWTADEFEVKSALGATGQLLTNLSLTFNGLTTGAGGMDTGSIPTSGFLGVYVIWGLGKTTALYGTNASAASKLSDVYAGGTGLPSGYTHSALISIVPTNGSAQILPCYQNDPSGRAVGFPAVTAASGTTTGISSTISLSAIIPFNAKKISGALSATISNASNIQLNIFSRPTQSGGAILSVSSSSGGIGGTTSFSGLSIVTPQSAFASTAGSGTLSSWNIGINEYFF